MELIAQDQINIKKSGSCADTFAYVLAVVLVAWLIFLQLCSISVTSGGSMLNTISDGDVLISYKTTNFDRGDVTTLWSTQAEKKLVKRVVGVPGDRLLFVKEGPYVYMYVNGNQVGEEYVTGRMLASFFVRRAMFQSGEYKLYEGEIPDVPDEYFITVKKDTYFILGDNRNDSLDSREYGLIDKKDFEGKVFCVIGGDTAVGKFFNLFVKKR